MTPQEISEIERNLFPLARAIVREQASFPWHRDQSKAITASQIVSSQALAIDCFNTIDRLSSRDAIVDEWMRSLDLNMTGRWKIDLEVSVPREVLGESRSTQIDALGKGSGGLVLFECKFTEADGGACSQPIPIANGAHRGAKQCNGNYEAQINPVNGVGSSCALTGKGIRYWDVVPEVMGIDPSRAYRPCPFAGGWYQWMRNLVAAAELGKLYQVPSAFVVVYADGPFPMARKVKSDDWAKLAAIVEGHSVPMRTVSYQRLLTLALKVASPADKAVLEALIEWMSGKMEKAK